MNICVLTAMADACSHVLIHIHAPTYAHTHAHTSTYTYILHKLILHLVLPIKDRVFGDKISEKKKTKEKIQNA